MIKWYKDDNIGIYFDDTPHPCVRYPLPSMTDKEKEMIRKYPFVNRKDLRVQLEDCERHKTYKFTIPKGYCYDGMTIPRFAWTLIGVSKENNCGLIAALIHDYLCEHKDIIDNNKSLSTNVFNALLKTGGFNSLRRFVMKNSVACFQTLFCRWGKDK